MFDHRTIILHLIFSLILQVSSWSYFPTIDPVESILTSNDSEKTFLCNGHRSIEFESLNVTIDRPIVAPPRFKLKTKIFNSTTIQISIFPNGFVGRNRILCFWEDSLTWANAHDLTIGNRPGRIALKEPCEAFDRRFVQCIFDIPTAGRAYRNGFERSYSFLPLNQQDNMFYREISQETKINENNEMIVRFKPDDRQLFDRPTAMMLTMSIGNFGNDSFNFEIYPNHVTPVRFSIEGQTYLLINHTNENNDEQRICAGHIDEIDKKQKPTLIRTITPTSALKIDIKDLRPSTSYNICLFCYYAETDSSFKVEVCQLTRTSPDRSIHSTSIFVLVSVVVLIAFGLCSFVCRKWIKSVLKHFCNFHENESKSIGNSISTDPTESNLLRENSSSKIISNSQKSRISSSSSTTDDEYADPKYKEFMSLSVSISDQRAVTPDTLDLTPMDAS